VPFPEPISFLAHAKLNLALTVGPPLPAGPRAGHHPIASWMIPIGLADRVTLTPLPPGSPARVRVVRDDGAPVDWPVETDLASRAHRALEQVSGPLPVEILVEKSIPAGGGLGGGSSDGAAVLRGLVRLFGLPIDHDRLVSIAHDLGSDLPFFLDPARREPGVPPRPALVTGLGEQIERLPARPIGGPILLIAPPFACPTGEVYRAFDAAPRPFRPEAVERLARGQEFDPAALFNDLAPAARKVRPGLGMVRDALALGLGRPVHVSGSGSTLFCFDDRDELARTLAPGSIVRVVHPTYVHLPPPVPGNGECGGPPAGHPGAASGRDRGMR
jgi:4-diphosphocytidyl-2-C-methyl-D-erythritol kinase